MGGNGRLRRTPTDHESADEATLTPEQTANLDRHRTISEIAYEVAERSAQVNDRLGARCFVRISYRLTRS